MSKAQMPDPTAYAVISGDRLYEVYSSIDAAIRAADSIDGYRITIERLITTDQAEAYAAARVRQALEEAILHLGGNAMDRQHAEKKIRALIPD